MSHVMPKFLTHLSSVCWLGLCIVATDTLADEPHRSSVTPSPRIISESIRAASPAEPLAGRSGVIRNSTTISIASASVAAEPTIADPPQVATDTEVSDTEPVTTTPYGDFSELLRRPLTGVTLASAAKSESTGGDSLPVPQNNARAVYSKYGTWYVNVMLPGVPPPPRNMYPLWHNPLYFEDPNLERCGRGCGILTEGVSALRFFGRVPVVPYMVGYQLPRDPVRSLPDCPACGKFGCDAYLPPCDITAAGWQGVATMGLIFIIP